MNKGFFVELICLGYWGWTNVFQRYHHTYTVTLMSAVILLYLFEQRMSGVWRWHLSFSNSVRNADVTDVLLMLYSFCGSFAWSFPVEAPGTAVKPDGTGGTWCVLHLKHTAKIITDGQTPIWGRRLIADGTAEPSGWSWSNLSGQQNNATDKL